MTETYLGGLSRRERQIMEVIYRRSSATAADVMETVGDRLSNSTIRAMLRILETKGHLRHEMDGQKYVFYPTVPKREAQARVLDSLLDNFFDNSVEDAVAGLIDFKKDKLTPEQLARLAALIEEARGKEVD